MEYQRARVDIVLLPDHLHMPMSPCEGDAVFPVRVGGTRRHFTAAYLGAAGREGPTRRGCLAKRSLMKRESLSRNKRRASMPDVPAVNRETLFRDKRRAGMPDLPAGQAEPYEP